MTKAPKEGTEGDGVSEEIEVKVHQLYEGKHRRLSGSD